MLAISHEQAEVEMNEKPTKQALGGEARAKSLTQERRREIAQRAAAARWGNLEEASLEGDFPLGESIISCAIVGNDTRVITQATFLRALGRARSPKAGTGVLTTVDELPFFLAADVFKPFITNDLLESTKPIFYLSKGGGRGVGYNARLLPDVAEVYLRFRDYHLAASGEVPKRYRDMVQAADTLIRGLAKVGIVALVDEATGYQNVRAKDALARILQEFLSEKRQVWTQTFPIDFYKEIFRLRDWEWKPWTTKRPQVIALWTNDFVYDRLAPGLTEELDRLNPTVSPGQRSAKNTQWFNPERGHPRLREHIAGVTALLRASENWIGFKAAMDRAYPKPVLIGENHSLPLTGGGGPKLLKAR
ncbi:MAG TPA: P63C domain-containing protein [Sphingobium sp.]